KKEFPRQTLAVLPEMLRQIQRFFRRIRCFSLQSDLPSSYIGFIPSGPLGSTGVTPLHRYYGPIRLPARHAKQWLCLSTGVCIHLQACGISQFPILSFGTRRPLRPRGARWLHLTASSPPMLASSTLTEWPLPLA